MWAEVRRPDSSTFNVRMAATESEPHSGAFKTSVPGVYSIRVRAQGETIFGSPFTREQTLTAVAVVGGGTVCPEPTRDAVGELLCCLLKGGDVTRFLRHLEQLGLDGRQLLRCLRTVCVRNPEADRERRSSGQPEPGRLARRDREVVTNIRALLDRLDDGREALRLMLRPAACSRDGPAAHIAQGRAGARRARLPTFASPRQGTSSMFSDCGTAYRTHSRLRSPRVARGWDHWARVRPSSGWGRSQSPAIAISTANQIRHPPPVRLRPFHASSPRKEIAACCYAWRRLSR
jgi:hypothetical protein